MGLIITLLIIWLVLSILGFVVKGLLWLAIIGLVLFVATAAWGWLKRKTNA
jgi:LPXTG-motif cell wall-anchored protein